MMQLRAGSRLGPYEVQAQLGAGGMGAGRAPRGIFDLVIVDLRSEFV
jgi:hypothetical protein